MAHCSTCTELAWSIATHRLFFLMQFVICSFVKYQWSDLENVKLNEWADPSKNKLKQVGYVTHTHAIAASCKTSTNICSMNQFGNWNSTTFLSQLRHDWKDYTCSETFRPWLLVAKGQKTKIAPITPPNQTLFFENQIKATLFRTHAFMHVLGAFLQC
jgi:hypothetical protein